MPDVPAQRAAPGAQRAPAAGEAFTAADAALAELERRNARAEREANNMPDNETLTAEEQALIANHRARKVANVNAQAEVDAIMAKKGQLSADELEKLRVAIIANLPKYVPIP